MENYNLGGEEDEAIRQRMRMAELLRQQGMSPMNSNVGYRISPLEGVAKMFQSYMGARDLAAANADKKALLQSRQDATTVENEKLARLLNGGPAMPMPTRFDDDGNSTAGLDVAAQAPDRRGAINLMMQSQDPVRRQLGLQLGLQPQDGAMPGNAPPMGAGGMPPPGGGGLANGQGGGANATAPVPSPLSQESIFNRDPSGALQRNAPMGQAGDFLLKQMPFIPSEMGRSAPFGDLSPTERFEFLRLRKQFGR